MRIDRLTLRDFRNIREAVWQPADKVNIVYGENAQGKTNLLEALWLFTGGRSFRRVKDSELRRFGTETAELTCDFFADGREQEARITIDTRRHLTLGGVAQSSSSRLTGLFTAVVFFPDHLSLVKDGPEGRRRFLDAAVCQLRPAYVRVLSEYTRLLAQRNALLKDCRRFGSGRDLIPVFTEKLAVAGAALLQYRLAYADKLREPASRTYDGLSGGREKLTLCYEPEGGYDGLSRDALRDVLLQKWEQSLSADLEAGFTTVGPHREDLYIAINDKPARLYGSQGQQRSTVLSLKMAEAELLKEITGDYPIVLLDDVMSELDAMRQDYLVSHLKGWQVFITCCEPSAVHRMTEGRVFRMEQGVLQEE